MKKETARIKGLHTPRIFLWMLGVIHGKIIKTAALDPDSGKICSAYVLGREKQFRRFTSDSIATLEYELKGVRAEALNLTLDYYDIHRKLNNMSIPEHTESVEDKRLAYRTERDIEETKERLNKNRIRMSEISRKITDRENITHNRLNAAASAVQSQLSAYCHGALLKPVLASCLPDISCDEQMTEYHANHVDDNRINDILMEVMV